MKITKVEKSSEGFNVYLDGVKFWLSDGEIGTKREVMIALNNRWKKYNKQFETEKTSKEVILKKIIGIDVEKEMNEIKKDLDKLMKAKD